MKRPDAAPVPDLYLERYRLGELPEDERRRIEQILEADPELRDRLQALERSEAETSRLYPTALMGERIRQRPIDPPRRGTVEVRRRPGWLWPAVAAASLLLAVGVTVLKLPAPDDGVRLKGSGPELVVYRKTAAGSERLGSGALAGPGDLIRVGYRAAGRAYGVILSTDGNGNVTQHLPRSGRRAAPLEPGGTVLLDFAYELDDAPRWERFYLVTGDAPFELDPVRDAAREVAAAGSQTAAPLLEIPPELAQSIFTLRKESVS
jgi:hypothetical protein